MSLTKFYSYNHVVQSETVITANDEDVFHEIFNLKLFSTTDVFRTNGPNGEVVFDFRQQVDFNSCLVVGHNISGIGFIGNLTLQASNTNEWGDPPFEVEIVVNPEFNYGEKIFSKQRYRYARIICNGAQYFELASIFIGESVILDRGIGFGWSYKNIDNSTVKKNRWGKLFGTTRNRQRVLKFGYDHLTPEEVEILMKLSDAHGKTIPLWFTTDDKEVFTDSKERYSGLFRFVNVLNSKNQVYKTYSVGVELEEYV